MPFNLVKMSQRDPQWKDVLLGNSDLTMGTSGCAIASIAMYLSGWGYAETPASLNEKLKANGGYFGAAVVWAAVSRVHPQIRYKNLVLCTDSDAPLTEINASLVLGQPVLVQVDSSPSAGLQTHWVVLYAKQGNDYLMLDPWPFPSDSGEALLMARYSQGKPLERAISAVVWYESPTDNVSLPAPAVVETDFYVQVVSGLPSPGLRVRAQGTLNSDSLGFNESGTRLRVIEPVEIARPKVGVFDQWIRVRNPDGLEGYSAAWYLYFDIPAPSLPVDASSIKRIRKSLGGGLEDLPLAPEEAQKISLPPVATASQRLAIQIWNRYGKLLSALAKVLKIDPSVAVAVFAVESGGQAFGANGHLLIRFEIHLFHQYWGKNNQSKFDKHFKFNADKTWTGHQWRPTETVAWRDFHGNQSKEWEALTFARALDDTSALKSISMGAPQIMGFNHRAVGFATVQDMFTAFAVDERNHVLGFFDFLQGFSASASAISALQKNDFTTFAKYYNGSGQAEHYGNLIKTFLDAFNQLPKPPTLPVEPAPPGEPEPVPTPPVEPTPPHPQPVPEPTFTVYVSPTVGTSGLRLRAKPSTSSALVTMLKARQPLEVQEPEASARPKIGKDNQWLKVHSLNGQEGFVAAWLVIASLTTPPVVTQPTTPPAEPAPPAALSVRVSTSVGSRGLRLRQNASTSAALVGVLPAGTVLTVLEAPTAALIKIGKENQWLHVRTSNGLEGFVAAWFVEELSAEPLAEPIAPAASEDAAVSSLVVRVSSLVGGSGLRLRDTPSLQRGTVLKTLSAKTPLIVLESPAVAEKKVGIFNQWLKVKEPLGAEGYIAAWYITK